MKLDERRASELLGWKSFSAGDRELAQLVERHPYKVDVAGSNPVLPTKSLGSSHFTADDFKISKQDKHLATAIDNF